MNKKSPMGVKVLGALALILIAAGTFIACRQLVALPAEAIGVLDKTDPSGVRYWSALGSGGKDANIGVRCDYESQAGVKAYIAWNKSEAARLLNTDISTFWVVVNFNGPQPREGFKQFVQDYDMEVIEYTMRAVEPPTPLIPEGNRVTAKGGPDNGVLIPDDLFNRMYGNVVGEHGAAFKGWITVRGGVDRKGVQKLQFTGGSGG